jgi:hypothetical protein
MKFAIETVLTIVTGISFERGLQNAKKLVEFMTGEPASEFTFLEGSRPKICKQYLIEQYPGLAPYTLLSINQDNAWSVLGMAVKQFGEELDIDFIENMPTPEEYLEANG